MKQQILDGLAEIMELPSVAEDMPLDQLNGWDSLAIVCTVALLDEKAHVNVGGDQLFACKSVRDVLRLAGAA